MNMKIVNLTLAVVIEKIEDILDTYPNYPYHQAFSPSNLRQELINYVLNRISTIYTVIEEVQEPLILSSLVGCSSDQRHHIERLIHRGIGDILRRKYDFNELR